VTRIFPALALALAIQGNALALESSALSNSAYDVRRTLNAGPSEASATPAMAVSTLQSSPAPKSRRKAALIGLGVGLTAGALTVAVRCRHGSERADCYRAGWLLVVPTFSVGGAVVGLVVDRATSHRPSISVPTGAHVRRVAVGQRRIAARMAFRF